MSAVLSVQGLGKRFGELQALCDVSFEAAAGETVAVIGPNGAGKTTLLSIIAGVQGASAGTVSVGAGEVGWTPQQPAVYGRLTVAENLELFARLEKVREPRAAVERMLEQTGLRERAAERVARLSGGNRQRVNVALGLIGDPAVLALDEPSASLDPVQRERLWEFIAGLTRAGRTVVFSTHNAAEAQHHARRVIVLAEGRVRFDGTVARLLREGGEDENGDLERALVQFLVRSGAHSPAGAARAARA